MVPGGHFSSGYSMTPRSQTPAPLEVSCEGGNRDFLQPTKQGHQPHYRPEPGTALPGPELTPLEEGATTQNKCQKPLWKLPWAPAVPAPWWVLGDRSGTSQGSAQCQQCHPPGREGGIQVSPRHTAACAGCAGRAQIQTHLAGLGTNPSTDGFHLCLQGSIKPSAWPGLSSSPS